MPLVKLVNRWNNSMNNVHISDFVKYQFQYSYPVLCQLIHCSISLCINTLLYPCFILFILDKKRSTKINVSLLKATNEFIKLIYVNAMDIFNAYEAIIKFKKKARKSGRKAEYKLG
jgi:hypothetical protein